MSWNPKISHRAKDAIVRYYTGLQLKETEEGCITLELGPWESWSCHRVDEDCPSREQLMEWVEGHVREEAKRWTERQLAHLQAKILEGGAVYAN